MALQPKSSNLPDMQEPVVSASTAQVAPILVPGSENAVAQENCENPKGVEELKHGGMPAAEAQHEQPQRATRNEEQKQAPVLGQH